ncbi:MAG: hypothetical protein KF712_21460, partial [Akkermansiaceae bacterium]|nr:hypothetical protein [Akkermansiaceae bacterium]
TMEPKKITASGLIWIGDEGATSNALLVPVEVVTPALNHNEEEIFDRLFGAEELKVAKMEDSLDENGVLDIDADPHRFHVRIPSRLGGKPVTAKLGTSGNLGLGYNDPVTEIPLTANPFQQESQSQLLVSDEVDDNADVQDEQPGDRTHRIMPYGDVEISEVKIGSVRYPLSMKVRVKPQRIAEVRVIFVGTASAYQGEFTEFIKVAKERFAQSGIHLDVDTKSIPAPTTINEDDFHHDDGVANNHYGGGNLIHQNMKDVVALADSTEGVGLRTFTLFVVNRITGGDVAGRAFTKKYTAPIDQPYTNRAVLSAEHIIENPQDPGNPRKYTLGHELGHLLTNDGHYGGEYGGTNLPLYKIRQNLMKENPDPVDALDGPKRLTIEQEKKIKKTLDDLNK